MAYPSQPAPGGGIPLGTMTEIMPNLPDPALNGVGGPAFAARPRGGASNDMVAILCNSGLPPRIDMISSMRSADHAAILRLVDSGVVQWLDDSRHFAFAYQRPAAPRLKQTIDEPHQPMSEDALSHYFIMPMIGALAAMERTGLVHNAIRTTNIFWRAGTSTMPQLGECLSAPPGLGQPALFETIERAQATPLGRGPGAHSDDCYAFGVTLALLILGQNPLQGMDDAAIAQLKLERGTFNALINNRRLPSAQVELLRGLLTDDARQRWTAPDLEQWLNGRRLTPKNTDSGRRAARAIEFAGKEYLQLRPLAAAMAKNIGEATHVIESGMLDKWLRRSLGDDERAGALDDARSSLKEGSRGAYYEDQLVARACIALDPMGPIHYRGLSVLPAGIPAMLAEGIQNNHNVQVLSEIISSQLITLWVEMQKEPRSEIVTLGSQFERMRNLIEKVALGNGVERVVYELNAGLQCLSPSLRAQYVTTPKALLPALERVANSGNRTAEPMDRHIAAFLIVRDRKSEMLFDAMTAPEHLPKRGLALLTLYNEMQQKYGPENLSGLAQWLLPRLEPAVRRYLGRTLREKMQTQLRETAQAGNLAALLRLVDDPDRIRYDQQEFLAARMLYLNIMKEIAHIEHRLSNRDIVVRGIGKPMAASLSSFLAIMLVVAAMLRALWQGMGM